MRSKGLFRGNVFRRHLVLFLITILTPTCLILSVYVIGKAGDIREGIKNDSIDRLDRASKNLDMLFDMTDRLALQLSLTPSIKNMLTQPFDMTPYDYYQVKEQLRGWTSFNSLYYSVYIYISQTDKVLTTNEGLYEMAEFFDAAFIRERIQQIDFKSYTSWIGTRNLSESISGDENEIISIVKSIPVTGEIPLGLMLINIDKQTFLNTVAILSAENMGHLLAVDPQNQLVSDPVPGLDVELLAKTLDPGEVKTELVGHGVDRVFVTARKNALNGWTMLYLTPYDTYSSQVQETLYIVTLIFTGVLVLGIGIAYLFSSILYDPWRKMEDRLKDYVMKTFDAGDVYAVIDQAIHNLIDTVRHNEPILLNRLTHDILHRAIPEDSDVLDRFAKLGVDFVHPHFLVLVISADLNYDPSEDDSQNSLYLYSLAEEVMLRSFKSAGTMLDKLQFAFLLNMEKEELSEVGMNELEACCKEIIRQAKEQMDVSLLFCIGGITPLNHVHEAYELARHVMTYKAVISHSGIFYAHESKDQRQFEYPAAYHKLLLNPMMSGERERMDKHLSELFNKYIQNSDYPLPMLQQMILMLMSHVISSLAHEGYDIGPLINEAGLLRLQACSSSSELQSSISKQLHSIIDYLESVRAEPQISPVISRALDYMENHYSRNISISDIAAEIGISGAHLSRLFKVEVGKTPLEYLTEYRLEQGKKLLADSTLPLHEICKAIGYNDAHTFIRYFKKHEGTTPGEYRKKLL